MTQMTDNWLDLVPNMISLAKRKGTRIEEFEPFIIQHPVSAANYASSIIRGPWQEAEESISTDANASYNYSRNVIRAKWEKGEEVISADAGLSLSYAKDVLKSPFAAGEAAIANDPRATLEYARHVLRGRFLAGEPCIAKTETTGLGGSSWVENYYESVVKSPADWHNWTEDQLKLSPCWMYNYAKDYLKGRLPDVLHNHMFAFSMTLKDNYYVKKYFKAKRYQKKVKYRRKKRFLSIAEEVNSLTQNN